MTIEGSNDKIFTKDASFEVRSVRWETIRLRCQGEKKGTGDFLGEGSKSEEYGIFSSQYFVCKNET